MIWEYGVQIDDETDVGNKIYAVKRPNIPVPVQRFEEKRIPGRDGTLTIYDGSIEDISIYVEFNFMGKQEEWFDIFRKAKKWLLKKGERILSFGDDTDFHYIVKRARIDTAERVCYEIGKFTAEFICKGTHFYNSGKQKVDYKNILFNPGIFSQPIYKIIGEGMCTLTVNGKSITANVGQNLTIDTELMISYREDGTLQNTAIKGNYEDLYLHEGENKITITDGFECKVIPRWRCL